MRYKNGVLSAIFGVLQQLLTLTFGLIVPRLFIRTFGSEMNGFLSSLGNVYSYLALVEAGVGTAAIQALYAPLGRDDKRSINEIMAATAEWYNKAGFIYFVGVIAISIFYPLTVKTTIPKATIAIITILSGMGGVLNFWVQGKYNVLLQAEGKKYLMSIMTMVVYVAQNIMKIVLLLQGYDVIAIHVGYFLISLSKMLFYMIYIKKNYSWLNLKATPRREALNQSGAVFFAQIMAMITSNTDILVLTYVAQNLKAVSVYNVYLMVFSAVEKLFSTLFGSFHYMLGQKFNTDFEGYLPIHKKYESISMYGALALYAIAFVLTTPFMKIYTAGITDIKYVDPYLPILFTAMEICSSSREASARVISFAGHFKQMQWSAFLEAALNISISIVLVLKCGIYGVLLGSLISFSWRMFYIIWYANKKILHRSSWNTYKLWLSGMGLFILISVAAHFIDLTVNSFQQFFAEAFVCGVVIAAIYIAVLFVVERDGALFLFSCVLGVGRKLKLQLRKNRDG